MVSSPQGPKAPRPKATSETFDTSETDTFDLASFPIQHDNTSVREDLLSSSCFPDS
jgi:hypothetical protein